MKGIVDFIVLHETLIETICLSVFVFGLVYYLIFTLLFEFICFAKVFNERHNKPDVDLTHKAELDTLSVRLRAYT